MCSKGTNRRCAARSAAALAALLAVGAAIAEPVVLEDFEQLPADSAAQAVTEGKGVTHGAQAAMLREGANVSVDMTSLDANVVQWLKIDTLTTQPLVQRVNLAFKSAKTTSVTMVGHVQPGSDCLWIPISSFRGRFGGEWPGPLKSLEIANSDAEPITIDHVRAEQAAEPPPDCVLLDFGSSKQIRWPGFVRADSDHPNLVWPAWTARGGSRGFPDPLTRDYVGPSDPDKTLDVQILAPGGGGAFAWAWLTHDFLSHYPPTEYALQVAGRNVLSKRLTSRQYIGPDALARGSDGAWTAPWYAKDFSDQLCSQVAFPLRAGSNRIRILNSQFAALAMGPASRERALTGYVKTVNEDLQRFRRQFVVATRKQAMCTVQPTAKQQKAGLMVFAPQSDRPFDAAWVPQDANEAKKLQCTVGSGQLALVDLAVVPTRPLRYLTPGVEHFMGRSGTLRTRPPNADAWVVQRVPNATHGTVEFVPWLLRPRVTGIRKDEIVHVAVAVWVSEAAESGTYRGNVLLGSNAGTLRVPLEITVVKTAPLKVGPTFIPSGKLDATRLYGPLGATMSKPQAAAIKRSLYTHLQACGMNAFPMPGPDYNSSDQKVSDSAMRERAQEFPPRMATTGRWVIYLKSLRDHLSRADLRPNMPAYAKAASVAIAQCRAAARKLRAGEPLHYAAYVWDAEAIRDSAAEAALLASLGARLVLHLHPRVITNMSAEDCRTFLQPYAGLIVSEGNEAAEAIRRFKALGGERVILLHQSQPERYAAGFRPAVLGADGVMNEGILPDGPVFDGQERLGDAFAFAENDRALSGTLSGLLFCQGADDMVLWKQCQQALAEADQAGRSDARIDDLRTYMAGIQKEVLVTRSIIGQDQMADRKIKPRQLQQWRMGLLERWQAVQAPRPER